MNILKTAGAIAACLAAGAVAAQTPPPAMPKLRQACAADFQRLCPDVTPGHGAVAQCIKGHVSDLSPDCKSALMARREAMRERRATANLPAAAPTGPMPPN